MKPRPPSAAIARRARALGVLGILAFIGLAGRLAYLQLYRHSHFVQEAAKARNGRITIAARRGGIMDRNGIYLVHDRLAYEVVMDPNSWFAPRDAKDKMSTSEARKVLCLSALRRLMPQAHVDALLLRRPLRPGKKNPKRLITYDLGKVTPEVAEKLKAAKLPGIGLIESGWRSALDGSLAPHIVGFTDSSGAGLEGLERRLNGTLGGTQGVREAEFDTKGSGPRVLQPIPGTVRVDQPVIDGKDVQLTIDARVQKRTQDVLTETCKAHKAESGSAVVLDPRTGEIVALASYPTFDVNKYASAAPGSRLNRAVVIPYEPGSTLKAMTVAAAMESGVVNPDRHFFCTGSLKIGSNTIHCASHGGSSAHGDESLLDVIRTSCNVATAQCAFKLSKPRLYEYLKRFGLTQSTRSGLPGEHKGQLTPPSTWSQIKLANVGFGQGIAVTPLQLAGAYGVFADGIWRQPHIVKAYVPAGSQKPEPVKKSSERRVVSPETARQMRKMLAAVVERGTGRNARLTGYTSGGKTGTAQIAEGGHYGGKYVASFVGLAPLSDPQLVVLVAIRDPKGKEHYGGEVAAPAFRQIAEDALLLMRAPQDRHSLAADRTPVKEGSAAFAE